MLHSVSIKDFAIISSLDLSFSAGLNIFTGETGAGKSIVIEALGFVLGARGDVGLIRQGASKIIVSAVFDSAPLPAGLKQKYKIADNTFTVRRELDNKSKGRCKINELTVLVADLDELGSHLVDFHGQHEHQALFKACAHMDILDSYANLDKDLEKVKNTYAETQNIKAKIAALKMSAAEREKMLELYRYQLSEIEKLNIRPEEEAEIETLLPKLKHAAKLKEQAGNASSLLNDMEGSACELLSKASRILGDMASLDSSLEISAGELASALDSAQEIAASLSSYSDNIDADPEALDNMLSRQETLRKIKLKYGPSLEDVLLSAQKLKKDIEDLETGDENTQKLEAALASSMEKLLSFSDSLYEKRLKASSKLSELVVKEISPLGFEQVRFAAGVEHGAEIGPKGADNVEFLFSSNPGQALRPLRNIASGGEIARLMLGLKTVLAGGTPVMVFDEIDTGISGHTGKLVGAKLKRVSCGRQVLCVTHLPQVAAFGDRNFNVSKFVKNNNTEVKVSVLEGDSKVEEIARMIGSSKTASAGYKHAQDLLQEALHKN